MAKTFDGPPTLERSGSEHWRAVTSFLLRRKAWLEVELSLQERRRDRKVSTEGGYNLSLRARDLVKEVDPSLMGKSDAIECNENSFSNCRVQLALSTKKDGMIRKSITVQRNETLSKRTIRLSPNTYILTALLYNLFIKIFRLSI